MPSKTVTVGSAQGLHARPAAVIAEAVVNAGVPVTVAVAKAAECEACVSSANPSSTAAHAASRSACSILSSANRWRIAAT